MTIEEKNAMRKAANSLCLERKGIAKRVRSLFMDILSEGEVQFREMPRVVLGHRLIKPLSVLADREGGVFVTYRIDEDRCKTEISEFPLDEQIFMLIRLIEDITVPQYLVVSSWTQADTIDANSKEEAIAKAKRKLPSDLQGANISIDAIEL